ncbi:hypothetical protein JL722_11703 [Aureococcus anophagefferens]|nr:hypothetical protein JL722_11703 [Aureococcus anophagefferens]
MIVAGAASRASRAANPATKLSLIRQPVPLGGCFTPTLEVLDASGALDAKATGPCCFGGWSEICCDSTFVLKRGDAPLATITHLAPLNFCDDETCAAICTDSDKFQVKFDATASATDKANAVAAGLLVDYMFYEIDHGLCGVENNCTGGKNIHCTLFLCYVAGCLLPCNISIPLDEPAGPCAEGRRRRRRLRRGRPEIWTNFGCFCLIPPPPRHARAKMEHRD